MNSKTQEETEIAAPVEATVPETTPATKTKGGRKPKGDLTLGNLAEKFIAHLQDAGHSPGTCSSYTAELKLACKEMGSEIKIADITTEMVQAFFDCKAVTKLRSGKRKASASVAKSRRIVRLALVWAAEKKWIESAPIPQPAGEQA